MTAIMKKQKNRLAPTIPASRLLASTFMAGCCRHCKWQFRVIGGSRLAIGGWQLAQQLCRWEVPGEEVVTRGAPEITGGKVQWAKMKQMAETTQAVTFTPAEVVRRAPVTQAPNGICYASLGEVPLPAGELDRMVAAVPRAIGAALQRKAYYFVPLTVSQGDDTVIAERYDVGLSDNAVCHRNLHLGDSQCVFISTRLMDDKFSIAFEFYINVAHAFVDQAGVSEAFADLAWKQVEGRVRGETSIDAWETRKIATGGGPDAERARNEYLAAAFSDAIAIYMLATLIDVDYYDLREREYPLLAPGALGERLRKLNELFPTNPGFEFNIYHRRR